MNGLLAIFSVLGLFTLIVASWVLVFWGANWIEDNLSYRRYYHRWFFLVVVVLHIVGISFNLGVFD